MKTFLLREKEKIIMDGLISSMLGAKLQRILFQFLQEIMPIDDTAGIWAFSSFLQ